MTDRSLFLVLQPNVDIVDFNLYVVPNECPIPRKVARLLILLPLLFLGVLLPLFHLFSEAHFSLSQPCREVFLKLSELVFVGGLILPLLTAFTLWLKDQKYSI